MSRFLLNFFSGSFFVKGLKYCIEIPIVAAARQSVTIILREYTNKCGQWNSDAKVSVGIMWVYCSYIRTYLFIYSFCDKVNTSGGLFEKTPKTQIIYIYVYCDSQTGCFVVSHLFSEARPMRCIKPRLKLVWLYVSRISYPTPIVILSTSDWMFYL